MNQVRPYGHLSLAAAKAKTGQQEIADTISSALSLVELQPEMDELYTNNVFFTPKQRFCIEAFAIHTARTVTAIYAAFDMLSEIVTHGDQYEDMLEVDPNGTEFASRISKRVSTSMHTLDVAFPSSGGLMREVKAALSAHMHGSNVIRNSVTKPGGKDIIICGTPLPTTDVAGLGNFNVLRSAGDSRPLSAPSETYDEVKMARYTSEIAMSAQRAAKQLSVLLFGKERTRSNMLSVDHHQLPTDFDFTQANHILASVHPALNSVNLNLFTNLDSKSAEMLKPFFRYGFRAMPSPQTAGRFLDALKVDKDAEYLITDEALALDIHAEASMIMALDKEVVEYICQGDTTLTEMCLSRWFKSWGAYYLRLRGGRKQGASKRSMVPRYVTSATALPKLVALREQFGYSVTKSRANEHGLTAMPDGTFAALPSRDDVDQEMVSKYEHDLNGVMSELFEQGIPLSTDNATLRSNVFRITQRDLDYDKKMQGRAQSLERYQNIIVGVDPDFDVMVSTSSSDGGAAVAPTYTVGAKEPSALDTADILGFDFAQPGEAPNFRSINTVIENSMEAGRTAPYRVANNMMYEALQSEANYGRIVSGVSQSAPGVMPLIESAGAAGSSNLLALVGQLTALYEYALDRNLVPSVKDLIAQAKSEFPHMTVLSDSDIEKSLYDGLITDDFNINANLPPAILLMRVFIRTFNDSAGLSGSNLLASVYRESGDASAAAEQLVSHPNYFSMGNNHKLGDMHRVYNYFGGQLFQRMCQAIADADRKALLASLADVKDAPQGDRMVRSLLPNAIMFARVVPNTMDYYAQAEDIVSKLKPDESLTAADIQVPGLREGVALMPHQVGAHKYLRQRPRNAVLFIAPGGGKTILGITDIAALMKELDDLGDENLKPLVVCPTNLATTWADDLHKICEGWNAVPITTDTVNTWGEKRLYEKISEAPRNTIFIAGLSFITGLAMNVDVGGVRIKIRGAVEFINRFGFNYVLLDESHKVKNFSGGQSGSTVHFNTKKIFTAPSIKYARIASGTIVTDRVTDVVGQAALLSPTIFGDSLEVASKGSDSKAATISRTHSRFSNHTAFINFKRKHWAFMLPNPIDTFLSVDIADPSVPHSELHQEVYNAMYSQMLEKLNEAAKKAKSRAGASEDEEGEESDDEGGTSSIGLDDADGEEDGDVLGNLLRSDAELRMFLQRMEQMLTDPMGDDVCVETFRQAGVTKFVSAKVTEIINRIKKHFEVQPSYQPATEPGRAAPHQTFQWQPGVSPREYDIAVYEGQKYMARKQTEEYGRQQLPPSMTPPPQDPNYWKPERSGKLLVFCRYTRAVNCIYDALPEEYKRSAVRYHGEVGKFGESRDANLDAFKTNDDVLIMIANEQAISEGHNMQIGSRIIRCDTPWSPGVYDQSTARIFRPDVSAASLDENGKPGDLARELVFIDWIMTNRTLEVGKVARLMWKTVEKVQFDEKGNPLYDPIMDIELEPIRMSPQILLDSNTMDSFIDYFRAKRDLNEIEAREFSDMRKTTVASMQPLTPVRPLEGFGVLESVPFVANQKVPDRHNHGLVRLLDWVRDNTFTDGEALRQTLMRKPIHTEFGNGQLVGIKTRTVTDANGKKVLREDSPISTIRVRLAGSEELITIPATKAHIATNITPAQMDEFYKVNKPWATQTDRKRAQDAATEAEIRDEEEDKSEDKTSSGVSVAAEAEARATVRKNKRKQNQKEGKPLNDGVKAASDGKRATQTGAFEPLPSGGVVLNPDLKADTPLGGKKGGKRGTSEMSLDDVEGGIPGGDNAIDLLPTIFNGFIGIFADAADPDAKLLTKLKGLEFIEFGEYAYVDCLYYADFDRILTYLENIGDFDRPTERRLEFIQEGFQTTGRMNFNVKQAQKITAELKQFFLIMHRSAQNKTKIKAYPMVLEDRLRIMFDLRTNPMIRKLIGMKVPKTAKFGTFQKGEGIAIAFCANKTSAKAKINAVVKSGLTVTNKDAALKQLTKMQLLPPKASKK